MRGNDHPERGQTSAGPQANKQILSYQQILSYRCCCKEAVDQQILANKLPVLSLLACLIWLSFPFRIELQCGRFRRQVPGGERTVNERLW